MYYLGAPNVIFRYGFQPGWVATAMFRQSPTSSANQSTQWIEVVRQRYTSVDEMKIGGPVKP